MRRETRGMRLRLAWLLVLLLVSGCAAQAGTPALEATPSPPEPGILPPSPAVSPGRIRPATVAGSWYPGDPQELAAMVDGMLAAVEPVDGAPIGLIVPHAGYAFSGPVAAVGFRQLQGTPVEVAVVVASDHQPPLSAPISVWAEGGFETPLGVVPVDVELAQALIEADPRITFDARAHEGEHPIEIELPFLQRTCAGCRIVPVLMGRDDEETVQALADALLKVLAGRPPAGASAVVIASSDLSHYPAYDDARVVDGTTLAAVETGDPARVRTAIDALMDAGFPNLATCACGQGPILVAMRVAQGLGADTVTVLSYANSGDSPHGDQDQVVGYGAVMLWRYEPPALTPAEQKELLELARNAVAEYLRTGQVPGYATDNPVLARRSGAFVTLKKRDANPATGPGADLRGCVGHTRADLPLYQVVQQMAVAAATEDARFPPLTPEELDEITIEISVLSPFRRVMDTAEIQVGAHGLMLFAEGHQGLLLPQVPVEQGWDREEFLRNLCLKAELLPDCLDHRPALYMFTAVVLGEE